MDRIARDAEAAMRNAETYAVWHEAASVLDQREGLDDWMEDEASADYDWSLLRARLRQLRQLRQEGDVLGLVHHLRQGLHWNIGNIGNPVLYAYARTGTKNLIEQYLQTVVEALEYLADGSFPEWPHARKVRFFREVTRSFGQSGLLLSGGATLGLFHVGVVKAIYLEGLLPRVLSGSSAGSVVAAAVSTRTEEETLALLDPENSYYRFWRALRPADMLRFGSVMDPTQLRKAIAANVPDVTFEEAFERSGRSVNITVSPAGSNQQPRLLNHLTFPYLCLREAVAASCAVPLIFPPVMLMTRDARGARVPFMPTLKWNDGSLKSDLPVLRLRRLHNVNHFVVSQTNPHVIPFMARAEGGPRAGRLAGVRKLAMGTLLQQSRSVVDILRAGLPDGAARKPLDVAASMLDQNYRGNITIMPQNSLWRFMRVTANPRIDDVRRFILEGERATWPRMAQVRNQLMVSQALERCLANLEAPEHARQPLARKPRALRLVRQKAAE
ncbi:DUF3336 domain-containing protein [Algiphilus sp.]|uniref:DUF3336 domain-containing protein n=1 Tax=Algiphilus sp. TaxID=1872431 RepID=UPI0025C401EC|nr:DUF3336 domain-containing protein [Algiphilus sp.]